MVPLARRSPWSVFSTVVPKLGSGARYCRGKHAGWLELQPPLAKVGLGLRAAVPAQFVGDRATWSHSTALNPRQKADIDRFG